LFGQGAFQPAIAEKIPDDKERTEVSDDAWSRYSVWNLAAHGVVAATWFAGRTFLSGREVSGRSRALTRVKDALIVTSLLTGVGTMIIGKLLGAKAKRAASFDATPEDAADVKALRSAVKIANIANVASNIAVAAVSTTLAMQGNKSLPFAVVSRLLP
jgi:hypothetical protein